MGNSFPPRLEVIHLTGFEPLEKPSDESLDAFEVAEGFSLPATYRSFIKLYGPGDLGEFFQIMAPGYAFQSFVDLADQNRVTHEGDDLLMRIYGDHDLLRRLVYFSFTYGGDCVAWGRPPVSGPKEFEYPIYGLPRDGNTVVQLALSFPEFVESVLNTTAMRKLGYSDPLAIPPTFQPYVNVAGMPVQERRRWTGEG